jgi:acyl carrier protein
MKSKEEIFQTITKLLADDFECPKEELILEARLYEDLDLDSIDAVDLVVRLQKITEKRVNPEAFRQVRTLGDVVDVIYTLLQEENGNQLNSQE